MGTEGFQDHTTSAAAAGEAVRNYSLMSSWNNH